MNCRPWKALVAVLAVQALVAGAAATLEWTYPCGACRAGGFSLGLIGFAFYTGLFLAALFAGPTRFLFSALLFGFGVHVLLVAQILSAGLACWVCFAAAGLSAVLAGLSVACDRENLARMALLLPWSVLAVLAWGGAPRAALTAAPSGPAPSTGARLTVFTQPDCRYCDELEREVLPALRKEFGDRLEVVLRPAQRTHPTHFAVDPCAAEREVHAAQRVRAHAE
ncbi:MAG: hypothetical protein ACK44W_10595 [Planctomycetota bacterium]